MKKRKCILYHDKKRNARYLKHNQKFGIDLPNNVEKVHVLDKKNGNTLWADSVATEMTNVKLAFQLLDIGTRAPRDYQFVKCHMVYTALKWRGSGTR